MDILLSVIEADRWIKAYEIHAMSYKKTHYWPPTTRKVLRALASKKYGLLKKRVYEEYGDDEYFQYRGISGRRTFIRILSMLKTGPKKQLYQFRNTDYFTRYSKYLPELEIELENEIKTLASNTLSYLEYLKDQAENLKSQDFVRIQAYELDNLIEQWQNLETEIIDDLVVLCKRCSLWTSCIKKRHDQYGDAIELDQLHASMRRGIPAQILAFVCLNERARLDRVKNDIQMHSWEYETGIH